MSYYDHTILSFQNQVREKDFRQAWILWEKSAGSLRHRWLKVLIALLFLTISSFFLPGYRAHYATSFVPICGIALLIAFIFFQIFVKIRMAEDEADRIFGSNRLLGQPEDITITREGYTIKGGYESLKGYWAEAAQCLEAEAFYAVTGGPERPLLILCKKDIPPEKLEEFGGKMKSIFAARYHRVMR